MMKKLESLKRFKPLTLVVSDGKDSIHINEWELRELQLEVKEGIRDHGQKVTFLEVPIDLEGYEIEATITKTGVLSASIADTQRTIDDIQYITYGFTGNQMGRWYALCNNK